MSDNKITFYSTDYSKSLKISPGSRDRDWIEEIPGSPYYFDLPMTMAAQSGWVFEAPDEFTIEWNGGPKTDDVLIHSYRKDAHLFYTGLGNGIGSIKTNFVVETPDDYALLITGAPNFFKDGAVQLTTVMESGWAYMPILLSWKLTRPGRVTFKKGDPIGFVTIIPHKNFEKFDVVEDSIMSNHDLYERWHKWDTTEVVLDPYFDGTVDSETGEKTDKFHTNYRKLKAPTLSKELTDAIKNGTIGVEVKDEK